MGWTAVQSKDIDPKEINDPDFVMTRHHIAQFKLIIKPMSLFVTINRTEDEIEEEQARLYIDKYRDGPDKIVIPIATKFGKERFYNHKRTIQIFEEDFDDGKY